jgi:uncharacterized protein YndB with AHSA1/START domain
MTTETAVPPILRTVTVSRSVEEAFRIFTEEMAAWWPLDAYSRAYSEYQGTGITSKTVIVEGRAGGRIYEVLSDGTETSWGEVLVWEPPHRVVYSWKPHSRPVPPTEVEVTFTGEGERTRVDVEHRGWDRLGDVGPEARETYAQGWPLVLASYQRAGG